MRAAFPLFLLTLAACGGESEPAEAPAGNGAARTASSSRAAASPDPSPAPAPAPAPADGEAEASGVAADTLRRYYDLIGRREFAAAWALRARPGDKAGLQRFIANYDVYESYRATVGVPSQPVEAGGWVFVEVPVMIYGRFRGGKGFGNAGSVTLRKAAGAAQAAEAERKWHIYTG